MEPQYPETLQSFTDGIKGDVFEMFNSIHKSFKMLFPVSLTFAGFDEGVDGSDDERAVAAVVADEDISTERYKTNTATTTIFHILHKPIPYLAIPSGQVRDIDL